ncbi:MAG: hypothetical protein SCJ94_03415 [Bacillota bacterium]|nr:DUF370 domain-containing protein [Bacillota bacterium]MDW7729046.1 hypothetical protein [Bacillota bacterium]
MFLHIGGSQIVFTHELIGIFDYSLSAVDENINSIFFETVKVNMVKSKIGSDLPKSFIVTDRDIFISPISPITLSRRQKNNR